MPNKAPKMPDFLYPMGDGKNRDEFFLVEFDDVLQSSMEAIIYGLLLMPEERKLFPAIDEMDVIDSEQLYYATSMIDPISFLMEVRKDETVTEEQVREIIQKAHRINTWRNRSRLMMMYAMVNLATAHYVKRIDITNVRSLEQFELEHIMNLFGKDNVKLNFFQGSISSLLEDKPEYTTVYMRSTPELFNLLRNPEKYHLDRKLLLLRNSAENYEFKPEGDKIVPQELYADDFRKLCEGQTWKVGRFSSNLFDPPDNYDFRR